jgi:YHS domain-containing protein
MKKIFLSAAIVAAVVSIFAISNAVTFGNQGSKVCECVCSGCAEMTDCTNCEGCENCKAEGCSDCGEKCEMKNEIMGEVKKEPMKHSSGVVKASMNNDETCPVSGEPLGDNPKTLSYMGEEYKFCCAGCVGEFKAEPMDYVKEGLVCPTEGGAASRELSEVYQGTKYYFCCAGCGDEFMKDPEAYLSKFENSDEK